MAIVNRLFEIRTQRELTQQQVADLTGVSRVTVGRLDRNRRYRPKGKTMQDLARGLGLRIGELFDDDDLPEADRAVAMLSEPADPAVRSRVPPVHFSQPPVVETVRNDLVAPGVARVVVGRGTATTRLET
jgi:transcriptional regulator with XRE-family HTH domain